jgi:prepilin-type N-terminal cleavage/methylation domain-containing protein
MMNRNRAAFTLIEMLTVIAISAVLLTIIVLPIFQSFNLTRAAQTFATAQDDARSLSEQISREIGGAVSVRSASTTVATTLNGANVNLPASSLIVQLPGALDPTTNSRPTVDVVLPWTKIDILPPAQVGQGSPQGGYVDPVSGKIDPTLKAPKGQVQAPVVPSALMVRYGIGLRDPSVPYNEPYSGILMAQDGGRDNLIGVYRSQGAPYVVENGARVVNTALFAVDTNGNPILDDPRYLVFDRDTSNNIIADSHNLRVYHWLNRVSLPCPFEGTVDPGVAAEHNPTNFAHTVIETQISRFDMIMPQYNIQSRLPTYDTVTLASGTTVGIPRITPLLQFKPTVISNDPAAGQEALRPGEETDNAAAIAPDVYKTEYGLWNNAVIRTYPEGFLYGNTTNDKYSVGGIFSIDGAPGFSIYAYDPDAANASESTTGIETFDTYTYDNAVAALGGMGRVYPFSQAAAAANSRSSWLTNTTALPLFTPYHILTGTGKIITSFDISEVGNTTVTQLPTENGQDPNRPNLPTVYTPNPPVNFANDAGANYPLSPISGTTQNPFDINSCYNEVYNQYAGPNGPLQGNVQRFIDLRVVANEDGTFSPLYPVATMNAITGFTQTQPDGSSLNRVRITPGSEVVVGPDQAPGDHYGYPIRYVRVTTQSPGINQYRINYVDQQEPSISNGSSSLVTAAAYSTAFGGISTAGFTVGTYSPTNIISAVLQPRFKAGYIQLNSDPEQPLPQGYYVSGTLTPVPFKVDYRFQFTGVLPAANVAAGAARADTFAVDYDSRQLMQVLLTIRSLPQSNLPNPQTVTLKATASLRNVAR